MRLNRDTLEWVRNERRVMNELAARGYPTALMSLDGLSAYGYYEIVLDDNLRRQIDQSSNRIKTQFMPWNDPADWDWLLMNAPLEFEDGEELEEEDLDRV